MTSPEDHLFRTVFSSPREVEPLLRAAVSHELEAALDWATLAPAPSSLLANRPHSTAAELLFTAQVAASGTRIYLLLVRGSNFGRFAAVDMLQTYLHVQLRLLEQNPQATMLVSMVPILFHDGSRPWSAPTSLRDCFDRRGWSTAAWAALEPLLPDFHYLVLDLTNTSEADLLAGRIRGRKDAPRRGAGPAAT